MRNMFFHRKNRGYMVLIVILLILCILFFICPIHYSINYNLLIASLIAISIVCYFNSKKGESYLDFEPIFIIVGLISCLVFPLFVFPIEEKLALFFSFGKPYNFDCINKGTTLSAIGLNSFMIGSFPTKSNRSNSNTYAYNVQNNSSIFPVTLLLYLIYSLLGGFSMYKNKYLGETIHSSGTTYIETILIPLLLVMVFNEFWNKYNNSSYKIKKMYVGFALLISFQYMLVGNRTLGVAIALPIIIFFSKFFYKVSLKVFVLFMFVAFSAMIFIQSYREGHDVEAGKTWFMYISDMLIPNTTVYLACDIVETTGITWGKAMLQTFLTVVPMAQSLFISISGWDVWEIGSAYIFTRYLGLEGTVGIGSSYVAELYLCFGLVGVILFPLWLGKFIRHSKSKLFCSYNLSLLYFVLCGFSVYIVRASILSPLRFMVWSLFFAWYINRINRKSLIKQNEKV